MVTTAHVEQPKYTAVQTILLAAEDLTKDGLLEFSEWQLTVAAWHRDPLKFGLRGFHDKHPDHKRVMMEIMGQKPNSPVFKKLLEKTRPNTYRLTPLGKTTATRLRSGGDPDPKKSIGRSKPVTVRELYDLVAGYLNRPEFLRWKDEPSEPREWTGAANFFGIQKGMDINPADRLEEIRDAVKAARDWCKDQEAVYLTRGSSQGGTPIHVSELSMMEDFLQALIYRFETHLKANAKPKKRFDD
jgi:hypothetical protein